MPPRTHKSRAARLTESSSWFGNRKYTSNDKFPKISVNREIYEELASAANESGLSMTEIATQALRFALARLEWVEE